MPLLVRCVGENAISFDLASRGTALTLRLRVSFQPLTGGLSPAFHASSAQRSSQQFCALYYGRKRPEVYPHSRNLSGMPPLCRIYACDEPAACGFNKRKHITKSALERLCRDTFGISLRHRREL